jgi:hypothetical protein
MAGTIDFKSGTWYSSGGAFSTMVNGVTQHLLGDEASSRVRALLSEAVKSNLYYLDFDRDFDEAMRAAFEAALHLYVAGVRSHGTATSPAPELHAGFVERLEELTMMIERELRGQG